MVTKCNQLNGIIVNESKPAVHHRTELNWIELNHMENEQVRLYWQKKSFHKFYIIGANSWPAVLLWLRVPSRRIEVQKKVLNLLFAIFSIYHWAEHSLQVYFIQTKPVQTIDETLTEKLYMLYTYANFCSVEHANIGHQTIQKAQPLTLSPFQTLHWYKSNSITRSTTEYMRWCFVTYGLFCSVLFCFFLSLFSLFLFENANWTAANREAFAVSKQT